jgi:methionine salvage enolase-phosphatase E1
MKEKEKAEELYNYAVKLYGEDKAKEASLKSAQATHALAPYQDGKMKARSYWERVIEHLQNK